VQRFALADVANTVIDFFYQSVYQFQERTHPMCRRSWLTTQRALWGRVHLSDGGVRQPKPSELKLMAVRMFLLSRTQFNIVYYLYGSSRLETNDERMN